MKEITVHVISVLVVDFLEWLVIVGKACLLITVNCTH